MKREIWIVASVLFLCLLAVPGQADTCRSNGRTCLFVDAAGCAITCVHECWVTGPSCILGFGSDAICRCHDRKDGCSKTCQKAMGDAVGGFGAAVNTALTQCEMDAYAAGLPGGGCYFDDVARAQIEAARDEAFKQIYNACSDADVYACFGVDTVQDYAGRLLKNTESNFAGMNRAIFDDGPEATTGEPQNPDQLPFLESLSFGDQP
ncbi:MAG: hypothetical protein KDD47_05485 [Acidobacteria bacterium]|nr:hypothetical protein [Acidobacteriota bacterium]